MRIEDVPPAALEDLVEDLADLRHDLGKYITFGVRFLGPDPAAGDLRAALEADLHRTARRPSGDEAAWEVWARLRPRGLDSDPDVRRIDAGVQRLASADLSGDAESLAAVAAEARAVAAATRSLHQRAVARLD